LGRGLASGPGGCPPPPLLPFRHLPPKAPGLPAPDSPPAHQQPAAAGGSKLPVPPPSGCHHAPPRPPEGSPRLTPGLCAPPPPRHPRPPRRHAAPGHRACATRRRRARGTGHCGLQYRTAARRRQQRGQQRRGCAPVRRRPRRTALRSRGSGEHAAVPRFARVSLPGSSNERRGITPQHRIAATGGRQRGAWRHLATRAAPDLQHPSCGRRAAASTQGSRSEPCLRWPLPQPRSRRPRMLTLTGGTGLITGLCPFPPRSPAVTVIASEPESSHVARAGQSFASTSSEGLAGVSAHAPHPTA